MSALWLSMTNEVCCFVAIENTIFLLISAVIIWRALIISGLQL